MTHGDRDPFISHHKLVLPGASIGETNNCEIFRLTGSQTFVSLGVCLGVDNLDFPEYRLKIEEKPVIAGVESP